jgi:hypothetical protein
MNECKYNYIITGKQSTFNVSLKIATLLVSYLNIKGMGERNTH